MTAPCIFERQITKLPDIVKAMKEHPSMKSFYDGKAMILIKEKELFCSVLECEMNRHVICKHPEVEGILR